MTNLVPRAIRCATAVLAASMVIRAPAIAAQALATHRTLPAFAAFDSARALATFDSALAMLRASHDDRGVHAVDWDAVRQELRARAAEARTEQQLRDVLRDMIGRVGESHFGLVPRETRESLGRRDGSAASSPDRDATPGDVGLDVRIVEGRVTVVRVEPDGAAARAGIRQGWIVDAIDDDPMEPRLDALQRLSDGAERRIARVNLVGGVLQSLRGATGSTVALRLRDAGGAAITREMVRRERTGVAVHFGNLPTLMAGLSRERIPLGRGCAGVIRMNLWMAPLMSPFDQAMDSLRDCRGIVLDLRGNVGGIASMIMGVAGYFLGDERSLGTMRTRGAELRFVANPRRANDAGQPIEPYTGPLAILVDEMSVSTSEIFAVAMQTTGRARLFGERTSGQALPAVVTRLPNGDALMHVIADFTSPDGTRIEGRGAIPDEATPTSRSVLLAGRDVTLEAAVRWIRSQDKKLATWQ